MRAIWKGAISFSLINIPVSLYPATRREELKFHLLRKSDLSPIKYQRVAEADGKEVPWQEIVKGYEYEKGRFVVLEEEDFRQADVNATQTVEIVQFVSLKDIDAMFFDKPYYLEPDKRGAKAYALLREALQKSGKVGIAKVVIKTRQHVAALKPEGKALVLELMHFDEELIEPGTLNLPENVQVAGRELEMATELVGRMSDRWKPEHFADEYRQALLKLIEKKIELGGRTPAAAPSSKRPTGNVIDLVSVLQESLAKTGEPRARKPAKKKKLKKAA